MGDTEGPTFLAGSGLAMSARRDLNTVIGDLLHALPLNESFAKDVRELENDVRYLAPELQGRGHWAQLAHLLAEHFPPGNTGREEALQIYNGPGALDPEPEVKP